MLDRKRVNAAVEDLVRQYWAADLLPGEQILNRHNLIKDLKFLMDETVEKALEEGYNVHSS